MMLRDDDGIATPVEMMYLLIFCMVAVLFLGFVGRLHAAGIQVNNAAQSAARAASQAAGPADAERAARASVDDSPLESRCDGGLGVAMRWAPSPTGAWQGGSVTITVTCRLSNRALTSVWSPGVRTVVMADTQPVDRYHR